jgi:hypothetical protein
VVDGAVHDTATLSGENAFMATGKVKYDVYSEKECKTLTAEAGEVTVSGGLVPESKEETLSPGTYYWQATYSGEAHNEGSTTPCGEEIVVVGPTPPIVEQVTFTNNLPVLIDHQTEAEEKPTGIEEYGADDDVDWEYSIEHSETLKSWPVAYPTETTPDLKARFELPPAAKQLILEKRIEGKPLITGHTTLDGEVITFSKEFASAEALEAQVKKHEDYLEIGESPNETPISASKALPGRVGYETMTIEWAWKIKISGTSSEITQGLGSSTHNLFLTYAAPPVTPCKTVAEAEGAEAESGEEGVEETGTGACSPIYFTSLADAVMSIQENKPPEAQAIAKVWAPFANMGKKLNKKQQKGVFATQVTVPMKTYQVYDVKTKKFGPALRLVMYYPFNKPGRLAKDPVETRGEVCKKGEDLVDAMLKSGIGRCGAWAKWWSQELTAAGLKSEVVSLVVSSGKGQQACNEQELYVCTMLVKAWGKDLFGKDSTNKTYPIKAESLEDEAGIGGQSNENPPGYFWDHAIVKAGGIDEVSSAALYDPSYGDGPFPNTKELQEIKAKKREQPSETEVLEKYQSTSIEDFCRPTKRVGEPAGTKLDEAMFGLPAQCRKTAGGPLLLRAITLKWPN